MFPDPVDEVESSPVAELAEQLDEEARLRKQYAELAGLAGGLAHEIRNPLSTMAMNLDLLAEELPHDAAPHNRRLRQRIETIRGECRHLETILNAFLQFTRAGEIRLQRENLNAIVEDFLEFYRPQAAQRGIEISPHYDADLPLVDADPGLLRQVLVNLTRNSEAAMPHGGTLELQTRVCGDDVLLELIDSGAGIDPALCEMIFDPFFSRTPGGSGLGLPTVRKIIGAHRGTIVCDSAPGRGTRMTIRLPVAAARDPS